jgi:DNA-binding response OmpR family regulator
MAKRILFADNDLDFLDTRTEFLQSAGFQIFKANTLTRAEQCLSGDWHHLAIIDVRLIDDDDEKDASGLALAREKTFHAIPKIILTNYPSYQYVREVMTPSLDGLPSTVNFIAKQEGPEALISAVENAFAHHVRINFSLTLDWKTTNPFSLVSRIESGLEGKRLLNRAEELEDLFRRLFYEKDRIRIDRVLWQLDGRVALTVFAFKGAAMDSFVVVCGQNARVVEEANRAEKVASKAQGETGTVLADKAETTHFAANAYSLAQADLETVRILGEVYRAGNKKVFTLAIETLFGKTLAAWQSLPAPADRALEDLYRERLGLTAECISPQAIQARWETLVRYLPELEKTIPNPEPTITLLRSVAPKQSALMIKTPGTLTGDSILVDADGHAWLTDFANAGDAPQFWNFVALESAIRFDWVEEKELQCLRDIEDRLLDDSHFGRPDPQSVHPGAQKAVRSIQPIRRFAARAVGKECWQYHLGIFFNAAHRVADFDPTVTPTPNERARFTHALMAMALIAAKFGRAERESAPKSEHGLRVDKDGVKRDGKHISVRGQSYALLCYLADPPNQLRRRHDIVEKVLKERFNEQDENQIGRLHTAVRRLREKIEEDPDHPRYLHAESGGYRLVLQPPDE